MEAGEAQEPRYGSHILETCPSRSKGPQAGSFRTSEEQMGDRDGASVLFFDVPPGPVGGRVGRRMSGR